MATVSAVRLRTTSWIQARYLADPYFINWINELLEDLSGEIGLFKEIKLETGAIVEEKKWIDEPAGCRALNRISNPQDSDQHYRWERVNGRIKLTDAEVDEDEDPDTANSFSNYNVAYVDINIADAEEDDYKNYLFYITAGTYAGRGYVLQGNDESDTGTCRVYFLHDLSTALDGTKVTGVSLISPEYYVMLQYSASFDEVSSDSDEIPIDDDFEKRLTSAWISWKVFYDIDPSLKQTKDARRNYDRVLSKIRSERGASTGGNRIPPREIPGLIQYSQGLGSDLNITYAEEI